MKPRFLILDWPNGFRRTGFTILFPLLRVHSDIWLQSIL
uniref:Uncharacterized protein n=1 Tax=Rhizophora mucronata TaxID=61149 RepID=A0A2P2JTF4_RHIMU